MEICIKGRFSKITDREVNNDPEGSLGKVVFQPLLIAALASGHPVSKAQVSFLVQFMMKMNIYTPLVFSFHPTPTGILYLCSVLSKSTKWFLPKDNNEGGRGSLKFS